MARNSKNLVVQAIHVAHAIAAEVDIQALHGGTPAYVSKSFDLNFTSSSYIQLIAEKLEAMGYKVYEEASDYRPNVKKMITYTGEKPK